MKLKNNYSISRGKVLISALMVLLSFQILIAQKSDNFNFISPVKIPISLAGNFGELRSGHFHAGLDIRTQGREGLEVVAIDSGYVSRVAISQYGYGKVIYINHPNGFTSVYAHLQRFNNQIENYVNDYQYDNKKFELDLELDSGKFAIQQGELVGLSGNTGGSGGPHLHFEIRKTDNQKPINPLHFGYNITDKIPPTIKTIRIYPMNEKSAVTHSYKPKTFAVEKLNGSYILKGNAIPLVQGKIGFGIETIDHFNGSGFRNGVYKVNLFKDNQLVYNHVMDSFSFDETRYLNAHTDFELFSSKYKKLHRSHLLEGNKLSIYNNVVNRGAFFFLDSTEHSMRYEVYDYSGNKSILHFKVRSSNAQVGSKENSTEADITLSYGVSNRYEDDQLQINIPANALYENGTLILRQKPAIGRCLTPRYYINSLQDPLHDYMDISINISHLDSSLRSKMLIVSLDKNSKILAAEGGQVKGDWIQVKTRSFGPYTVMVDTIPPSVKLKSNLSNPITARSKIWFSAKDDISGLKSYHAEIDGQWILVEYQRNKKSLFLQLDRVQPTGGQREMQIVVEDNTGNVYHKSFNILY